MCWQADGEKESGEWSVVSSATIRIPNLSRQSCFLPQYHNTLNTNKFSTINSQFSTNFKHQTLNLKQIMAHWLVKSEPTAYNWDQFVSDGKTTWDGIRNYAARNHLRA